MSTTPFNIAARKEFAQAYWGLIPVALSSTVYSGYPTASVLQAGAGTLHTMPAIEFLDFIRKRSWAWVVNGERTYDINQAVLEAVPNFDQDVDEYIRTFVRREFEPFEVAWPYWEEQLKLSMNMYERLSNSQKIG